jgi:FecR protein
MKELSHRVAVLLVLIALNASGQQAAPQQPTSLPVGSATVADLRGDVSLRSPKGDPLAPRIGQVLDPESTIETGNGSILLTTHDGSQALVKSHSRVVLKSPEVGLGLCLELIIGKLMAKVQKRMGEDPPFRMGTPSAVITVRGTRFEVRVTKDKRTYVEVFEGVVEVRGIMVGGRSVLIRPGFSTDVQYERDPQQPRNRIEGTSDLDGQVSNQPGGESERPGQKTEQPDQNRSKTPEQENGGRPD